MKELFRSCFLGLFVIACVLGLLIIAFLALLECSIHTPPENYYKKSMEFITKDTLPSCKIIKQKYSEEQYAMAIIKLSESDYQKVLNTVKSNGDFTLITDSPFSSVLLGSELKELMQKANITENNIAVKYRSPSRRSIGFIPPNRIVYYENFY